MWSLRSVSKASSPDWSLEYVQRNNASNTGEGFGFWYRQNILKLLFKKEMFIKNTTDGDIGSGYTQGKVIFADI